MSKVEFLNPPSIAKSPAFSQGAVITGNHKTIYVGGQNAIDKDGNIVGKDDIEKQAQQVLTNVEAVLKAGGAGLEHIVKWNIYFLKGQSPQNALKAIQPRLPKLKDPQLVTGIFVEGLTRPDFLIEIEAIAVVPG